MINVKTMKQRENSKESESERHLVVSNSLWHHGLEPARLLCPWNSPGKNTGAGCHFLLQVVFLTQGCNPGLLRCKQILYCLSHQGSLVFYFLFFFTILVKGVKKIMIDLALSNALTTYKLSNLFKSVSFLRVKEMATHSSILAWRIPGMAEPGGLPSMGHTELNVTEAT